MLRETRGKASLQFSEMFFMENEGHHTPSASSRRDITPRARILQEGHHTPSAHPPGGTPHPERVLQEGHHTPSASSRGAEGKGDYPGNVPNRSGSGEGVLRRGSGAGCASGSGEGVLRRGSGAGCASGSREGVLRRGSGAGCASGSGEGVLRRGSGAGCASGSGEGARLEGKLVTQALPHTSESPRSPVAPPLPLPRSPGVVCVARPPRAQPVREGGAGRRRWSCHVWPGRYGCGAGGGGGTGGGGAGAVAGSGCGAVTGREPDVPGGEPGGKRGSLRCGEATRGSDSRKGGLGTALRLQAPKHGGPRSGRAGFWRA
ncbi:hypothetical protein LEMLEM_LOCUS6003 [Lemmus lemmus]